MNDKQNIIIAEFFLSQHTNQYIVRGGGICSKFRNINNDGHYISIS